MADRRVARVCMVIANCHRDPKRRAYREKDFMPKAGKEKPDTEAKPRTQTADDMLSMLRVWNAAAGGKEIIH